MLQSSHPDAELDRLFAKCQMTNHLQIARVIVFVSRMDSENETLICLGGREWLLDAMFVEVVKPASNGFSDTLSISKRAEIALKKNRQLAFLLDDSAAQNATLSQQRRVGGIRGGKTRCQNRAATNRIFPTLFQSTSDNRFVRKSDIHQFAADKACCVGAFRNHHLDIESIPFFHGGREVGADDHQCRVWRFEDRIGRTKALFFQVFHQERAIV